MSGGQIGHGTGGFLSAAGWTDQPVPARTGEHLFDRPVWVLGVAVFLGVLAIYFYTLSQQYSADTMAFAVLATQGQLTAPTFFQAEHLLYPYIGRLWYAVWIFFGYRQGALAPLQVLSAAFGALGAAAFFLMCRLALAGAPRAGFVSLVAALLLASGYGYWFHSTEGEDQIASTALVIVAFLCAMAWPQPLAGRGDRAGFSDASPPRLGWLIGAAVAVGGAILAHATAVLALPALGYLIWTGRPTRGQGMIAAGMLAGVVAVPYAIVGSAVRGLWTPAAWAEWLGAAPGVGVWGHFQPRSLWIGAQSAVETLVYLQGGLNIRALAAGSLYWRSVLGVVLFASIVLATGAVLWQLAVAVRRGRSAPPSRLDAVAAGFDARPASLSGRSVVLCGLWLLPCWLFAVVWAPEDVQFWIGGLPPAILLTCLAVVSLMARRPRREEALSSLLAFGLTAVFVVNLGTAMLPRADLTRNTGYLQALCLRQQTRPADLIVTPGWDWAASYIPYFGRRATLSLIDSYLLAAGRDRSRLFALLQGRIDEIHAGGGRVFVVRLFTLNETDRAYFTRVTGLRPEDFLLPVQPAGRCLGEPFWEVQP